MDPFTARTALLELLEWDEESLEGLLETAVDLLNANSTGGGQAAIGATKLGLTKLFGKKVAEATIEYLAICGTTTNTVGEA